MYLVEGISILSRACWSNFDFILTIWFASKLFWSFSPCLNPWNTCCCSISHSFFLADIKRLWNFFLSFHSWWTKQIWLEQKVFVYIFHLFTSYFILMLLFFDFRFCPISLVKVNQNQNMHHSQDEYVNKWNSIYKMQKAKKECICLTSPRLSFLLLSSERIFNSRSPFGGVINISLSSISTIGTIAWTNGTHTSGPESRSPVFDFWIGKFLTELSFTCRRSCAPLLKTSTTVPIGSLDSYSIRFSGKC